MRIGLLYVGWVPYLTLGRSLSGEAVFEDADVSGGAPNVHHDGISETRQEGCSSHAVGGTGGEREDWEMNCLFCTEWDERQVE